MRKVHNCDFSYLKAESLPDATPVATHTHTHTLGHIINTFRNDIFRSPNIHVIKFQKYTKRCTALGSIFDAQQIRTSNWHYVAHACIIFLIFLSAIYVVSPVYVCAGLSVYVCISECASTAHFRSKSCCLHRGCMCSHSAHSNLMCTLALYKI